MSCVLCDQCFQYFWIIHSWLLLRFSLTFIYYLLYVLCLVYPMLPVFLDCPFLIAPSVFFNVYLLPIVYPVSFVINVSSISRLSILDCRLVFSNFYLIPTLYPVLCVTNVSSISGLSVLDCLSVFSNVYLLPIVCPVSCVTNVSSISGLSILDYSFGFL